MGRDSQTSLLSFSATVKDNSIIATMTDQVAAEILEPAGFELV